MRVASFAAAFVALSVGLATTAFAQPAMTLDAFVTQANRIPLNPLAAIRPDARRLVGVANRSFDTVRSDISAARAAGRRPGACPPERIEVNPHQLLAFLNAIPPARRTRMSVAEGFGEWMASRYPCPAA